MKDIQPFAYDALPGRVLFGAGFARQKLAEEVARLQVGRILLVAGEAERAIAQQLAAPIAGKIAAEFSEVRAHVPVPLAEKGRALAARCAADALLAIGGGSTTGMAKAIALETGLPIVCLPTTYAGSEMTPVWGMTDKERKTTGRSPKVLPKVVIYDPELTFSLPDKITGPSAINALAHCVEALYTPLAAPMPSLMALEGIHAIADGLIDAVLHPSGLEGRSKTLYGAYMAGAAFAVAGSGIHHKICHVLGGAYDLPHAEMHTIVLPHAVALNRAAIPQTMARIAEALGCDDAADGIFGLARKVGAPAALADIGMPAGKLDEAIALCLEVAPGSNPAPVTEAAMRRLLTDAFDGRRPFHA